MGSVLDRLFHDDYRDDYEGERFPSRFDIEWAIKELEDKISLLEKENADLKKSAAEAKQKSDEKAQQAGNKIARLLELAKKHGIGDTAQEIVSGQKFKKRPAGSEAEKELPKWPSHEDVIDRHNSWMGGRRGRR